MSTTSFDVKTAMSKELVNVELLSDDIFVIASEKFANLAHREETTKEEPIKYFKSSTSLTSQTSFESREVRISFDLAFSCLRYRTHLEELLIESGFLGGAPLGDDLNTLIIVMLWDFIKRKFVARGTRSKTQLGERIEEVEEVEVQLENYAIKLAACLARMRIRESALTLGDTLSFELKEKERIRDRLPIYGWINPQRASFKTVHDELSLLGIEFEAGSGIQDELFEFAPEYLNALELSSLVKQKQLLLVDSTTPIGPAAVANLLNGEESEDVLHCGGTTNSLPLLANIVAKAGKVMDEEATQQRYIFSQEDSLDPPKKPKFIICMPAKRHQEITDLMTEYGIDQNCYELVPPLTTLQPSDARLQNVKVVLVEPKCSLSAAADPLRFMIMEGLMDNDTRLLSLANGVPEAQQGLKLLLQSSLQIPRSAASIYLTRSSIPTENEEIIQHALETVPPKSGFRLTPIPLKLPVGIAEQSRGKYLRMAPSERASGCFLATISRNKLDPKHALRKGALRGLFTPKKISHHTMPTSSASRQSITSGTSIKSTKKR